jgi:predicted metal-dependent HD superfamily phosphohydrolase
MFDCRHQPLRLPAELTAQLATAYGESHRAYHNASHIAEVLGWFDRVTDELGWLEPAEVYTAIVFHDAIYQPGAKDNEARSAEWARKAKLHADATLDATMVDRDRVAELIELTAKHGHIDKADHDAAMFLDSDMAIIGSSPEQFAAYDQAIAVEYKQVPPDAYRAGRRAFLEGLLAKPRIFLTDYFHHRLDAQARANLTGAISR